MSRFKELKQKVKDNKYKILTGVIFVAGVGYVIINQNNKIKTQDLKIEQLEIINQKQQKDIDVLKSVMNDTVLCNLRDATKRQLRYAEGRLQNGLKDGVISAVDAQMRKDEIAFFSEQIENIDKAKKLISTDN